MKFALFSGCRAGADTPYYRESTKLVLKALGVGLEEPDFNCCGYSVKEKSLDAFLLLAIRNLAIAQARDLPVLTPCKCCFGSLKQADHHFRHDREKREMIGRILKKEGLRYDGSGQILHILTFLDKKVDPALVQSRIVRRLDTLKIAPNYGCHALRPSGITNFDSPHAPTVFERVIGLTGAQPVEWSGRLECCGSPLSGKNDSLSGHFVRQKYKSAKAARADMICTACNYCQVQLNRGRDQAREDGGIAPLPSVFITQLLGQAMGLDKKKLGIPEI